MTPPDSHAECNTKNILSFKSCLPSLEGGIIAVYGSGGKSSLIDCLAREILDCAGQVIVTTTTKIYRPKEGLTVLGDTADTLIDAVGNVLNSDNMVTVGKYLLPSDKLEGIEPRLISAFKKHFPATWILVEADGAAGLPLKGHDWHEPVIPFDADLILPVIGLSAYGAPAGFETIHRPHILLSSLAIGLNEILTEEHLSQAMRLLVCHGREQAPDAQIVPIFNQADLVADRAIFKIIVEQIAKWSSPIINEVLFTSFHSSNPVHFISRFESGNFSIPVCCVLLAAGLSRRMGRDKLKLTFRGKTILEHTLDNIITAGIRDIVTVIQPDSWVEHKIFKPGVSLVANPRYEEGLATSLQAGLSRTPGYQGVIFALADQPLITTSTYRKLIDTYCQNLSFIVYPVWKEHRGNPVVFDRCTWPRLMSLTGDTGGRSIFPFYNSKDITALAVDDPAVRKDLDNPGDYLDLLEQE